MNISRRSFFGGALVLAAAVSAPVLARENIPTLWGDGRHDDTRALQAMLDGKAVRMGEAGEVVRSEGGMIYLTKGTYLISDTLVFRDTQDITVRGVTFQAGKNIPIGAAMIDARAASGASYVSNVTIIGALDRNTTAMLVTLPQLMTACNVTYGSFGWQDAGVYRSGRG
jgi:hypothetical protein